MDCDVIIVGAGPGGLSAGLKAKELGIDYMILEKSSIASTLLGYPPGKDVKAYPEELIAKGKLPIAHRPTQEIVQEWEDIAKDNELFILYEEVLDIKGQEGNFTVITNNSKYVCKYVILAIGVQGTPRKICVDAPEGKVHYCLDSCKKHEGENVIVVGGGDSAVECALLLHEAGANVTISYRKPKFFRVKPINLERLEKSGIPAIFNSNVTCLECGEAVLDVNGKQQKVKTDDIFVMAGTIPPKDFLASMDIEIENNKPKTGENCETNRKGIFAIGDLGKFQLIKYAINHGYEVVEDISKRLGE